MLVINLPKMSTPVLIITSDIPFGEHIRQILEEKRRFVVRVTGEQSAAAVYAREFKPALAFLDTSMAESGLLKIGGQLRQANPEIIFVVISEAGWHSALEELFPRDYLSKPFYAPDLQEMMENFFPASLQDRATSFKKIDSGSELPWLTDVNRAAQHLTRLTLRILGPGSTDHTYRRIVGVCRAITSGGGPRTGRYPLTLLGPRGRKRPGAICKACLHGRRAYVVRHLPGRRHGTGAGIRCRDPFQHHPLPSLTTGAFPLDLAGRRQP